MAVDLAEAADWVGEDLEAAGLEAAGWEAADLVVGEDWEVGGLGVAEGLAEEGWEVVDLEEVG